MNDPIIVMDRKGLEALPVGAQVQTGGRTYVRSEDGFKAAFSTPEFTAKYIATKAPLTVLNPERLGAFVAMGDTVRIVKRFGSGRQSVYDGKLGTVTRIEFGKTWVKPQGHSVDFPMHSVEVAEQIPEPLTESLAELLPFYVKDPELLDELPVESVIVPLSTGWFPRVKLARGWFAPREESHSTDDAKHSVRTEGALVVSLGSKEFLPPRPDFW